MNQSLKPNATALSHFNNQVFEEILYNSGDSLKIPNCDVIRCDRLTGGGGGTAGVVRRNVDYCKGVNPILTSIESTSVVVNMEDGYGLKLISTYGLCGGRIHEADLESLLNFPGQLIVAGDWNAKHTSWGSRRNCPSGIWICNHSLNSNAS
nr:unnamed protein product [Callosobruchus analis]